MGMHYVNDAHLNDNTLVVGRPEAVMCEPKPDETLELIVLEYTAFEDPLHLLTISSTP